MRFRSACVLAAALALLVMAGCEKKERYMFFPTQPVVGWDALADGREAAVSDGFRLLVDQPTQGVFPASIGVARLAATGDNTLVLDMTPQVDFLAWNSCFDDLWFVSEVFPLNRMGMDGDPVDVPHVLTNAQALRTGLLLVYTEEQNTPERYDLRGALYDVKSQQLLAALHAGAFVQHPVDLDKHYGNDDPVERLGRRDPRIAATEQFEQFARDCLLALMANDEPAETVAPEGWIPDRPIEPLIWPPLDERGRPYDPRLNR